MNSAPIPNLQSLYWRDSNLRGSARVGFFGLIFAAGIWWMTRPVAGATPLAEQPPEVMYAPWVCAFGLVLAGLSAIVFVRRYLFIKAVLSRGSAIKGVVEEVEAHDTNMHSNTSSHTMRTTPTYAYYVTLGYAVRGFEQKVRLKLPHSASTYGMKQGGEVDLIVLDSAPKKPLIREMYLGASVYGRKFVQTRRK